MEETQVRCLDSQAQHARKCGSVCAGIDMALDFSSPVQSSSFRNDFDFVGRVAEEGSMSWLLCIASDSATTTAERLIALLAKLMISAIVRDSRRVMLHNSNRQVDSRPSPEDQIMPLLRTPCQSQRALVHQCSPHAFGPPFVRNLC
jgi:hypothetical protein